MKKLKPGIIAIIAAATAILAILMIFLINIPSKVAIMPNSDDPPAFPKPRVENDKVVLPEGWESVSSSEYQAMEEKSKFDNLDLNARLSAPKFNTKAKLYAASRKPSTLPWDSIKSTNSTNSTTIGNSTINKSIAPPPVKTQPNLPLPQLPAYSDVPYSCFIDSEGSQTVFFALKLDTSEAAKVVWQVSKIPFKGYQRNWNKPSGLVTSGELTPQTKEFSIDFSKFTQPPRPLISQFRINTNGQMLFRGREIPKNQRTYYVRAVPVNKAGECIGDPGSGIQVLYGKPLIDSKVPQSLQPSFELWYTQRQNEPGGRGEFPNNFVHDASMKPQFVPGTGANPWWFMLKGYSASASKIVVQVSTTAFDSNTSNWENPKGMVYSKTYTDLPIKINNDFANTFPINFMDFGPSVQDLGNKKVIYYVRGVALKPSGNTSGAVVPSFSDTIIVEYTMPSPQAIYQNKDIIVHSNAPTVTFKGYHPINWENPEWAHYFTVVRQPKYNEINFILNNKKTGETLYPYAMYKMLNPNTTPEYYETQVVPKFLVPGSGFKIVVKEGEKSWWGELWDGIVDFFKSILDVVAKVTDWVASTYNNLKTDLIKFAVKYIPVPGEYKDELEAALTALVDYGLASMGIPPTLPNFEELSEEGLDYAIRVAMQESGVPVDEITEEIAAEAREKVSEQMKQSSNTSGPNPINSNFIKNDPAYMYKPAYIDLLVENSDKVATSPTGSVTVNICAAKAPYYPVFEPVNGQAIPALNPGEKTTMRIYLKEWVDKPYPGGAIALKKDFTDLYWGSNQLVTEFSITVTYNLPKAGDAAHELGMDKNLPKGYIYTYRYDVESQSFNFKKIPCYDFSK